MVGLAGGIGSGKSSVAAFFRKWGARVVDADLIGHRVLDHTPIRARLVSAWGRSILDGSRVDRAALARVAFRSKRAIARLNRIVHPAIRREIRRQVARARGWVVLDAALLFEAGEDRWCDRVVYVRSPRAVRLRRTAARGWPPGELARRERLQWPAARKLKRSDYVIDNAGSRARTEEQARAIRDELRRSF